MVRRISILVSILLLLAACSGGSDATTTLGSTAPGDTSTTVPGQTTTTIPGTASTTTFTPTPAPDLSGLEGVSDDVRQQISELIVDAQEIRRLPFLSTPTITVLSDADFQERIRALLDEDSEDIPADEALYKMLGLLADEADLSSILDDLYGEQAYGYYDGEEQEIVVRARQDRLTQVQRSTLLHELVHALTDQHLDQSDNWQQLIDGGDLDQARAYQAMFEGDASWAEVLWVQTLPQDELGELLAESLQIETPALNAAPRFLREGLIFPYDSGLAFAQSLYLDDGGWESINDAYSTMLDLPGSTEQIITPQDYRNDLPMEVAIPDLTVPGYELERTSVWGEEGFREMLNQGTGTTTMADAADGWGGDSYHQWFDGQNAAMLIVFEGDTPNDVAELEDALLTFATDSFPEEHFAWVDQIDGVLYFMAADVSEVGEQIRADVGLG